MNPLWSPTSVVALPSVPENWQVTLSGVLMELTRRGLSIAKYQRRILTRLGLVRRLTDRIPFGVKWENFPFVRFVVASREFDASEFVLDLAGFVPSCRGGC